MEDERVRTSKNDPPIRSVDEKGRPLYSEKTFYQNVPCSGWDENAQETLTSGQSVYEKGESSTSYHMSQEEEAREALSQRQRDDLAKAGDFNDWEYTPFQLLVQVLAFRKYTQGILPLSQENLHFAENFEDRFFEAAAIVDQMESESDKEGMTEDVQVREENVYTTTIEGSVNERDLMTQWADPQCAKLSRASDIEEPTEEEIQAISFPFDWAKVNPPVDYKEPISLMDLLQKLENVEVKTGVPQSSEDSETHHLTRSGRVYAAPPVIEAEGSPLGGRPIEAVAEENTKVRDQLKKTPATITLWELLITSAEHRAALVKQLSSATIPQGLTPAEMTATIGSITMQHNLSFSDDDLCKYGRNHTLALHITVGALGLLVPLVLVDGGSTISVCPLRTATGLGYKASDFRQSATAVRAYDNTRREVMGSLTLKLTIGPITCDVEFQVLDVPASFNLLLGRAWIHPMGALPSTLHMKMKFPFDKQIVSIQGDNDWTTVASTSSVPMLPTEHDSSDIFLSGFHLEVGVQFLEAETKIQGTPARIIQKMGFLPGLGLGKHQQGQPEPYKPPVHKGRFGLGYDSASEQTGQKQTSLGEEVQGWNGHFHKEGEDTPYHGLPETWWDEKKKIRQPGWEIMYEEGLYVDYDGHEMDQNSLQVAWACAGSEEKEDEEYLIAPLFESCMLSTDADGGKRSTGKFKMAEASSLGNWTAVKLQDAPPVRVCNVTYPLFEDPPIPAPFVPTFESVFADFDVAFAPLMK